VNFSHISSKHQRPNQQKSTELESVGIAVESNTGKSQKQTSGNIWAPSMDTRVKFASITAIDQNCLAPSSQSEASVILAGDKSATAMHRQQ